MTQKSKIITKEIDKVLKLIREIDQDGDYIGVYALLLEVKCELRRCNNA